MAQKMTTRDIARIVMNATGIIFRHSHGMVLDAIKDSGIELTSYNNSRRAWNVDATQGRELANMLIKQAS